ncbi:MAG TPA: PQQ-dependent sugar dehydrogenase, partial [Chloroflexaceae bacterium]|nr:PQQ-dependent sugar dehydrogenase [Chloroflexaceae bacterium]
MSTPALHLIPAVPLRSAGWLALLALLTTLFYTRSTPVAASTGLPPGFTRELVATSLAQPTAVAFAPDGQMFIAQKNGIVRVLQNGALLPAPFIDLSAEVNNLSDRGLLGIAIHPDFPATPYVYLLYTYDPPGVAPDGDGSRVARLVRVRASSANPNVADPAPDSRVVILGTNSTFANIGDPTTAWATDDPACFDPVGAAPVRDCLAADSTTHTVGNLAFAPDGALLVSNGDGALYVGDERTLRSLDINSLSGKLLRIDPITGAGLPDNPFFDGDPQSNASKVYQLGLRNPFRFAVNPHSGQIVIGDVGWNTWEEINTGGPGANFGWPCYEGGPGTSLPQPYYAGAAFSEGTCAALYAQPTAVTSPLYAYDHAAGGAAAMAGGFYTGGAYPELYHGALFIADFNRNWIKYLTFEAGQATVHDFATAASPIQGLGPVHLLVGPDSNLYYSDIHSVYRIRYTAGGNTPPTAKISASATNGPVPLQVTFSGAGSYDPDAQALSYSWDFGDGTSSSAVSAAQTFATPGTYTVRLTVTDALGATGTETVTVTAGNTAPSVAIDTPNASTTYRIGDTIALSGQASDPEDGPLTGARLQWALHMHHNEHMHPNYYSFSGPSASFVVEHHGNNTWIEVCLTATDSGGLSATSCRPLLPELVSLDVEASPPGAQVVVEGVALTTPFELRVPAGSPQILTALAADDLAFASWADGPTTAERQVIAAPGMAPLRAEFDLAPGALMYRAINLGGPALW